MGRPKVPIISRDAATRAALEIVDEEDLSALSLERLAARLGVKAPSLYYHFKDKAEILSSVARLIMMEVEAPTDVRNGDWAEYMVRRAVEFRRAVLRHANAAPLLLEYLPRQLMLSTYERMARVLTAYEVPTHLHILLFEGVDKLTLGSALYVASQRSRGVGESLFPHLDEDRDPHLVAAVAQNPWDGEVLFAETVRSFVRGAVEAAVPTRSRRRAAAS
jgi:AcrR family transcriptional regulator